MNKAGWSSPPLAEIATVRSEPVSSWKNILLAVGCRATKKSNSFPSPHVFGQQVLKAEVVPGRNPAGERLFVAALKDAAVHRGLTIQWDDFAVAEPRVCDLAAFILSRHWPEKYQFDWSRSPAERDQAIAQMLATRHTEHPGSQGNH